MLGAIHPTSNRSDRRIRLLFVSSQLVQGGAERWLYEVATRLDPARFAVEVLASPLARGPKHPYRDRLVAAGIPVHHELPLLNAVFIRAGVAARRMAPAYRAAAVLTRARLGRRWFRRYDLVCAVMVENWSLLDGSVDPHQAVIHLMSNAIQNIDDVLAPLRDGRRYNLVLFNDAQRAELGGVEHDALLWPLAMDLADRPVLSLPRGSRRIGIFTRLSRQKPLEPFLYAFQSLRQRFGDAELHVFGGGDPELFGNTLDLLGLRRHVRFRGHVGDLVTAVRDERIAVCWMHSVDDAPGYAGIEVGSLGVPVLFWNLGLASHAEVARTTGGCIQTYRCVSELARHGGRLLADHDALVREGESLRTYMKAHHHIGHTISRLEDWYARAAGAARRRGV